MSISPKPKLLAVAGTNASGKSALGIALARALDGEIISADSRQLYRGFDLCSGKVTARERQEAPHHLLDIADVGETFSVADYQRMAYECIEDIRARGRLPIIVGGTGLYVNAVVYGYDLRGGQPDPALRAELEGMSAQALTEELLALGFDPAARMNASEARNPRRLARVLERLRTGDAAQASNAPRYDVLQLGVSWPRDVLAARIDERLDARLRAGMVGEVRAYLDAGGDPAALDSLGLEYRYTLGYVRGEYASEEAYRQALSIAIRQFAKRQMTWFSKRGDIVWLDMAGDPAEEALALARAFLARGDARGDA